MKGYRHFVLPPYILDAIAKRGNVEQRAAAVDSMSIDHALRTDRAIRSVVGITKMPARTKLQGRKRNISTCESTENLPGQLVRAETQPAVADVEVNEAYDALGATYDFYWQVFQRASIDARDMPLNASVHFGVKYDNAYWDGQRMVFGDGDGELFNRFTLDLDVVGHELTHGVTEHEAGLVYSGQSGALNESISDVFGVMVKQYQLGQMAEQADWLIGAKLFTPKIHGVALRSMKAPGTAYDDPLLGKDPQPADMAHFVHTYSDNGGVHTNSGIPNHAFYLLAMALGGNAWDKAGQIWYETILDGHLRKNAGFASFARLTKTNAGRLYGLNGPESEAVVAAWAGVGIKVL